MTREDQPFVHAARTPNVIGSEGHLLEPVDYRGEHVPHYPADIGIQEQVVPPVEKGEVDHPRQMLNSLLLPELPIEHSFWKEEVAEVSRDWSHRRVLDAWLVRRERRHHRVNLIASVLRVVHGPALRQCVPHGSRREGGVLVEQPRDARDTSFLKGNADMPRHERLRTAFRKAWVLGDSGP